MATLRIEPGRTPPRAAGPPAAALALALVVAAPPPAAAQADTARRDPPVLVGTVVDAASGTPLGFAVVGVLDGRRTTTDARGRFRLEPDEPGPWPVAFEQLGYRSRVITFSAADARNPVRVALDVDPIVLEGLEVVVDRFERRRRAYAGPVRAIQGDRLARAPGADGFSLLRSQIAGLTRCGSAVAPGLCFRRRGEWLPVKVCLDDRRSWDPANELSLLAPDDMYLVEIYETGALVLVYTRRHVTRLTVSRGIGGWPPGRVC